MRANNWGRIHPLMFAGILLSLAAGFWLTKPAPERDPNTVSVARATLLDELKAAADRAVTKVGPGYGPVYGVRVHQVFEEEVHALNRANLRTEVSYRNGVEVPRSTAGSVRLDVVEFGRDGEVLAVYDLKTGTAHLTPERIEQIQRNLGRQVPVVEVRHDEKGF